MPTPPTWNDNGNKCGYCHNEGVDLPRYECPECKRTGCPVCMPGGNSTPCDYCVEKTTQEATQTRLGF